MHAELAAKEASHNQAVRIEQLEQEFEENKAHVIEMLLSNCYKVDKEIPKVVRGHFQRQQAEEEAALREARGQ